MPKPLREPNGRRPSDALLVDDSSCFGGSGAVFSVFSIGRPEQQGARADNLRSPPTVRWFWGRRRYRGDLGVR
jgi:hypothetical protein